VAFERDSFNALFPTGGFPLYNDAPEADVPGEIAVAASVLEVIAAALNTSDANVAGPTASLFSSAPSLPVANGSVPGQIVNLGISYFGSGPWNTGTGGLTTDSGVGPVYITLTPVPLPAGLPLLLTALGSMGLIARRRSGEAAGTRPS
jgi:hypothetical protein